MQRRGFKLERPLMFTDQFQCAGDSEREQSRRACRECPASIIEFALNKMKYLNHVKAPSTRRSPGWQVLGITCTWELS